MRYSDASKTRVHFLSLSFFLILTLFFASCRSLSPVDGRARRLAAAPSPEAVVPLWEPFAAGEASGLAYFAGKTSRPRLQFNALRIDLASPGLRLFAAGGGEGGRKLGDGTFLSTKVTSFVRDNGLLAGINALPFDPVSGREGEPRINIGIVASAGEMISPPYAGFDALVLYADGGAAIMPQSEIISAENIDHAVGGFGSILEGGEISARAIGIDDRHPRSAAGISANGRFLYLLVIDGRRPGSIGSTEAETASLLRSLGAGEGINFDGGGSSALVFRYPDGKIRAANTPIHNRIPGRERAVAGCLGLR